MIQQITFLINKSLESLSNSNFDSAELFLKQALRLQPSNSHVLRLLGVTAAQRGNYSDALKYLNSAIKILPKNSLALSNLGNVFLLINDYNNALDAFDKSIKIDPKNHEFWCNKGVALHQLKRYDEAIIHYERALELKPNYMEAWYNKGTALHELKYYYEAIIHFERAIELRPNYMEAWYNKGTSLHELKHYYEAIIHFQKALDMKPDYAEAWSNKGCALNELKRYDDAIAHFDRALTLKPDYAQAWSNKGITLNELKRYEDAITHFDRALSLEPNYAEGWSSKGSTLFELKRYDDAITHFDRALSLKPDYAQAWSNKGSTLIELKRYNEAITHFESTLSLKHDIDWAFGDLVHAKMKICDWSGLEDYLEKISKKIMANEKVTFPFPLLALNDDASQHKKSSEIYIQSKYPFNAILGPIPKRQKSQKIRVGYFSPDFKAHAVSFLTSELFEIHDRQMFEVLAFSLQKPPSNDAINLRLRSGFDKFLDVDRMSDQEIARLAREYEIDIAIDLAGPTQYSRTGIFSYRAAPIQVNWLGYAGTLGANFMDYIVADKTLIPEAHRGFYVEKVAYLPNTYLVDDSNRNASPRIFTRQECGLPLNAFVFCCFNNDYKFNPHVLDLWSRIMRRVGQSVLWIPENNEKFRDNITDEFRKRGLDPSRLIFSRRVESMADHLARYRIADLFLDTYPYNAHSTAVDSLKVGTPLLTMMGQSFASRVAASLLTAIDLPELITTSQAEYEDLAVELATNPQKLAAIKDKLVKNRNTTPLFDTPLFTKHLEAAYTQMYERYHAGLAPDHISIY